jgi:hypothetical protein
MSQLALVVATAGLLVALGALRLVFQVRGPGGGGAGPIVQNPPVNMPVLILTSNLNASSKCGDKTFRGTAEMELVYLPAPGTPNAEVRVALDIRRSDNVTVSLGSADLGVFRNDARKNVAFHGELTNACLDGEFVVSATAVNQGPGHASLFESERIQVNALPYTVSMPHQISTADGRNFTLDVEITCCAAAARERILFSGQLGVVNLRAAPRSFTCAGAGGRHVITITGQKVDENTVGTFTVNARFPAGRCVLGSVQVE